MIKITPSPTADTRASDWKSVTKETLYDSSVAHIEDVRKALQFFQGMLSKAGEEHDFDKLTNIDQFYADFVTGFESTIWWESHQKINRHHLLTDIGMPEDVNLIDVLEMISDCVMAGMARSGSVYDVQLDPDILAIAFHNTVELLKANVKVEDK